MPFIGSSFDSFRTADTPGTDQQAFRRRSVRLFPARAIASSDLPLAIRSAPRVREAAFRTDLSIGSNAPIDRNW
jgi:hypothetical protein